MEENLVTGDAYPGWALNRSQVISEVSLCDPPKTANNVSGSQKRRWHAGAPVDGGNQALETEIERRGDWGWKFAVAISNFSTVPAGIRPD